MDNNLTRTPPVPAEAAGRAFLRGALGKNLLRGLLLSVLLHVLLIGGYAIREYYLSGDDDAPLVGVRIMKYSELGPPPSIANTEVVPVTGVSVAAAKPTVGMPVPVPDVEVSPEQTIATQTELSQMPGAVTSGVAAEGNVVVQKDIRIEEEEPSPDAFIPVEKSPVAVTQVSPEYPDLARRAGVEGVVWVKALIDKEGRVRKAMIQKSDSEIFNEAAIAAAMKWVFTPAKMSNGTVSVWISIPFRFRLGRSAS